MATHTLKVLFSETDSKLYPAVEIGFSEGCSCSVGDVVEFVFEDNYEQWKSATSADSISEYSISIKVADFVYKLKPNDNDPCGSGPDKGDYDLIAKDGNYVKAEGNKITVMKSPSKWAGMEYEYDVIITGNGKTGILDPRRRNR